MTVVVIDYLCPVGHRMFNEIHLRALVSLGIDLVLITRKGFMVDVTNTLSIKRIELQERKPGGTKLKGHIIDSISSKLGDALYLRQAINLANTIENNGVIILTYEIISYSLCFNSIKRLHKVYLFQHNNVEHMVSTWYKRYLTSLIPTNNVFVGISQNMTKKLKELFPQRQIIYVPHGIPTPDVSKNNVSKDYVLIIAESSCDNGFLDSIIDNKGFISYLKSKGLKLLIKSKGYHSKDNLIVISKRLNEEEYYKLLIGSLLIYLPYDKSFKYRTSGVLHECFALDIPVIVNNISAFDEYSDFCNYNLIINSPEDFIEICDYIISTGLPVYRDLKELSPEKKWREVFDI